LSSWAASTLSKIFSPARAVRRPPQGPSSRFLLSGHACRSNPGPGIRTPSWFVRPTINDGLDGMGYKCASKSCHGMAALYGMRTACQAPVYARFTKSAEKRPAPCACVRPNLEKRRPNGGQQSTPRRRYLLAARLLKNPRLAHLRPETGWSVRQGASGATS